jgi:hypothetical protein
LSFAALDWPRLRADADVQLSQDAGRGFESPHVNRLEAERLDQPAPVPSYAPCATRSLVTHNPQYRINALQYFVKAESRLKRVKTGMFNRFAQTKENEANFLDAQVPNKRIGTPEEIANAIVFIGSDKASYIIGASLAVDGGMIAD